jgi:hypothetical protein
MKNLLSKWWIWVVGGLVIFFIIAHPDSAANSASHIGGLLHHAGESGATFLGNVTDGR